MSVIAEFSVAAEEFILGKALTQTAGLSIELEKMIPTGDTTIPYFWVVGEGRSEFEAVLTSEPALSTFEAVDELDDRTLYRVEWDRSVDTFVQTIVEHDAVLQDANGDADSWLFQLRFPDAHALSSFHTACRERGIDVTVEGLFNPIEPHSVDTSDLTEAQHSLLVRAYDEGYFEVPRKITLAELAEELGVSDQALNERLRRGLSTVIGATLQPDSPQKP
ncbi:bacterio-opsin activator domain-containing protein [Halobaculum sp. D14]|uniref:helix-turn-helix domain-containing protein n=1 Tax=Halobaculum sp. D14 TaxID=3421642 RepID=UPI003EBD450C